MNKIFQLVHITLNSFYDHLCTLPCKSSFSNLVPLAQLSPNHQNLESGHGHVLLQWPASDMHSARTLFCLVSNVCPIMSQIYRTSSIISCYNKTVNSDTQLVNICFGELSVDQKTIHLLQTLELIKPSPQNGLDSHTCKYFASSQRLLWQDL